MESAISAVTSVTSDPHTDWANFKIKPSSIWVVIPAYNDEGALADVVDTLESEGYSIVIVDDGSRRRLEGELRDRGVHVCRHLINLGQGAALQTGFDYALLHGAEYLVTFDADGQHCAEDIPRLIEPIASGRYDIALGSRFMPGGRAENIPRSKLITLGLAIRFTRLIVGLPLTDTHNGLRAVTSEAARRIRITQNRMSHATQILQVIASERMRFIEVPVTIRYTAYSVRKGQSVSNAFNILWESITARFS
jgi:glycosyltransferase involved in cell wall biosynthesis